MVQVTNGARTKRPIHRHIRLELHVLGGRTADPWPGPPQCQVIEVEQTSCDSVSRKDAGVELALPWSSAAKCLVHDLIGPRRIDVATEGRLILVRHGEHCQQTLEGREIPIVHGCRDRLLHQMVARDESRVSRTHPRPALVLLSTFVCTPMASSRRPIAEGART